MIEHEMYDSLPRHSIEVTSPWDLGGDGKSDYSHRVIALASYLLVVHYYFTYFAKP